MIQGVFFDLFGTLLIYGDMSAALQQQILTLQKVLQGGGQNLPLDLVSSAYISGMSQPVPAGSSEATPFEAQLQAVTQKLGADLNKSQIGALAEAIVSAWQAFNILDPFCIPLLSQLHASYRTALISNFDYPPHILRLLPQLGIRTFFDTILISGMLGINKPDKRIFEIALQDTHLDAGQVIFVGDTAVDIQGALNAGIHPVYIRRPNTAPLNPELQTRVTTIDTLPQLLDWLQQNSL